MEFFFFQLFLVIVIPKLNDMYLIKELESRIEWLMLDMEDCPKSIATLDCLIAELKEELEQLKDMDMGL